MDKATDSNSEDRQDKRCTCCKNKRKLVHHSVAPANASSSLIEFPRYELPSEALQGLNKSNSSEAGSDQCREEQQVPMCGLVDWNDPIASQLEELLLSHLQYVFHAVVKEIVELGYTEEEVLKSISRRGLYREDEDPVSHIVRDTVAVLEGRDLAEGFVFENFQHLLYYTMVEMVGVVRELRPTLTVGDSMWTLMMCDLNVLLACSPVYPPSGVVSTGERSASSSVSQPKLEVKTSESDIILEPALPKDSSCSHQNCKSEAPKFGSFQNSSNSQSPASEGVKLQMGNASLPVTAEKSSIISGAPAKECKSGPSSKRNRKEIVALRQKFLHMEKTYRSCGKGGFKSGKITSVSGLVVEKRLKQPSEIPNQQTKCGSSNTTSLKGVCCAAGAACRVTNGAAAVTARVSSGTLPAKDATSTPIVNSNTSASDAASKPSSELGLSDNQKVLDYCAGIPYDESLGKYVPRHEKDELILKLIDRVQELQLGLQSWHNWTNQKVMQVTEKLGKIQAELKALRKERQEALLFDKDKKVLEENAAKRISEMENAMENSKKQIESATSAAVFLEAGNSLLKNDLSFAKIQFLKSMSDHEQAMEREQTALKQVQAWESQNGLIRDELHREKRTLSNLQQELNKEKNLLAKVEARLEKVIVATEKFHAEAASIRMERKQIEARIKSEEDKIRKRAASEMQNYVEKIAELEKEFIDLKLKSESEQIAALSWGVGEKNDSFTKSSKSSPTAKENKKSNVSQSKLSCQGELAAESLRREQECVMCLSAAMTVVFLPCAHQVLCPGCNELHEKQGMKECPSCRGPIKQRIHAQFVGH